MENNAPSGLLQAGANLHGRYRIVRIIGRGGMSAVYEAEHLGLGKRLAIKEMLAPPGTGADVEEATQRFQNEARTLARLNHPYFPNVTDFFSLDNRYYLVMEYVDGETLEDHVKQNPGFLREEVVVRWAGQLCDALSYLHSQSPPVVFRDLKPSNIMIDEHGQVKLIDFGIARIFKPGKQSDTQMMGTAGYSAPEQYGTGQTDARSDVYALGAVLHYVLTRRDPAISPFNFPSLREINPRVSLSTERVVTRCLSLKPDDRFPSAAEVKKALTASALEPETTYLARQPRPVGSSSPMPTPGPSSLAAPPRAPAGPPASESNSWVAILLVILTVLAVGAIAFFIASNRIQFQPQVGVPDVTGQDPQAALQILTQQHLGMTIKGSIPGDQPVGQIVKEDPAAGAQAKPGDVISVWQSAGPGVVVVAVPDVTQMSEDQARKLIVAGGLKAGQSRREANGNIPKNYVIRTEPAAGIEIAPGQPVDLVVSSGPKPVPTPAPVTPGPNVVGNGAANFDVEVPVPSDGETHEVKVLVQQPDGVVTTATDQRSTQNLRLVVAAPSAQAISATVDGNEVSPHIDPITPGSTPDAGSGLGPTAGAGAGSGQGNSPAPGSNKTGDTTNP